MPWGRSFESILKYFKRCSNYKTEVRTTARTSWLQLQMKRLKKYSILHFITPPLHLKMKHISDIAKSWHMSNDQLSFLNSYSMCIISIGWFPCAFNILLMSECASEMSQVCICDAHKQLNCKRQHGTLQCTTCKHSCHSFTAGAIIKNFPIKYCSSIKI